MGGYGVYIALVRVEVMRQIRQQHLSEDPLERYQPIYIHGRYHNPFPEYRHQSVFEFAFRRVTELFRIHPAGSVSQDKSVMAKYLPVHEPDWHVIEGKESDGSGQDKRMTFTWIGQSCAFVQFPGKHSPVNILTDPMFSESVISSQVGPQRLMRPPCSLEELPVPDAVLVSHDHQDHLDFAAAKKLGNSTVWVVPKGVGRHLSNLDIQKIVEMSWWQRLPLPNVDPNLGYEVACTPAMHWSGRYIVDSNQTLWCSFLILKNGKPLFFHVGDSGFAEGLYETIAKVYGTGCRLAAVPCGAYEPRWHLKSQHMCPTEALRVMRAVGARSLVGVHWGTFIMSEEPYYEPPQLLLDKARNEEDVLAPEFGSTVTYNL